MRFALAGIGDWSVSGRPERLARLLTIRRLSEELDCRALQVALASVAEVEAALGRQERALTEARSAARTALSAGDRGEWLLSDAQSEVARWNRARLSLLLRTRSAEVPPAMKKFLVTRLEHEQVKQLVDDAKQAAAIDEDRKAQAVADDWFLSKRSRASR
jgi:hypothetical protein